MKRLLAMLTILFIFYFIIQILFSNIGNGHVIKYTIMDNNNLFTIDEIYVANTKGENNNYYFNITINNNTFKMQTYTNFYGGQRVIKGIKYYNENNYQCILPIFSRNKLEFDIMCLNNNTLTPYYALKGLDSKLDEFADSLSEIGYSPYNWEDRTIDTIVDGPIAVYRENILSSHYLGVNNYRGLYTINNDNIKKVENIKLFSYDIYKRPLSGMIGRYYITADYSQKYAFNKLFAVNLVNNEVKTINTRTNIDFDAYVQGVVDDKLYIFDRANMVQYEINIDPLVMTEVGNKDIKIKYYENGAWTRISAYDAVKNDIIFNKGVITMTSGSVDFSDYDSVDKMGNKLSGFYYLYQKQGNDYWVYKANVQDITQRMYLFTTNKIDNISYVGDFVYFTYNNEVRYYHSSIGIRTVFKNSEFEFNNSLYFHVYKK